MITFGLNVYLDGFDGAAYEDSNKVASTFPPLTAAMTGAVFEKHPDLRAALEAFGKVLAAGYAQREVPNELLVPVGVQIVGVDFNILLGQRD